MQTEEQKTGEAWEQSYCYAYLILAYIPTTK